MAANRNRIGAKRKPIATITCLDELRRPIRVWAEYKRLKPREPRRKVMLAARMRHGDSWSDANILNLSSRGLQLHTSSPPSRGAYVEVRRGEHVIVGRVIWSEATRFGVLAQDRLTIDALIANTPRPRPAANDGSGSIGERRAQPRSEGLEWRQVQHRNKGRSREFLAITAFGIVLAGVTFDVVAQALSKPLSMVSATLGGKG